MRCMKTGLRFNVPEYNDDTYHADMFYNKSVGCAIIRGAGKGTSDQIPDMKLYPHEDSFVIRVMTDTLRNQLHTYFPDLDLSTLKVIIDDTRFF